jgi:hypothetical protein
LPGIELGNRINESPLAGETFGRGPSGSAAIVYVGRGDCLTLMDQAKRRNVVATIGGVSLPAWSGGGTRLPSSRRPARRSTAS